MKRFAVIIVLSFGIFCSGTVFPSGKDDLLLKQNAFQKVAEEVGPAVVSVTVVQVYTYGGRHYRYPYKSFDPFLDEFLKEFFEAPREYRQRGLGSGVIIDGKGYILTNEHVVNGANQIEVTLSDGRKFGGVVRGTDPRRDLAVIKIDADNLPVARLGDSDRVKVGQWVVAIGNPFGFIMSNPQPTLTVGVVSALHRNFGYTGGSRERYYGDLIQTDAAINRGNSGGPLVNLKGEIVGINALIFSTTGGSQGIGFAIPINNAKRILKKLISGKEIKYGWLGVQVQSLTKELSEVFKLPGDKGALVADVIPGGPADTAGIKKGDLILKVNGRDISDSRTLVAFITGFEAGERINITVFREGKEMDIPVAVGQRPEDVEHIIAKKEIREKEPWRGIRITGLTAELKRQLGILQDTGVVVSGVEAGSPAAKSGMREGDVIDEIDRKEISTPEDFYAVTGKVKKEVLVHTGRGYFVVKEE